MLRGALIGFGNMAVHGHLPGWLGYKGVELVAAADVSPTGRGTLESLLPQARWYDSTEELLQTEALDFVDICTPPATHAGLIRSALGLGLHVLCEKPLVLRPEDLLELAALAEERDRVLYTVHNWNHAPILAKVGELIREGAIGQIRRSFWKVIRSEPAGTADRETGNWRMNPLCGGGILIDHGWHAFYLLEGWFGRAPNRVSARLETRRHREWPIEDTATVCLEYPAATAEIFLTWASQQRRNCLEVEGTRGTIRVEGSRLELLESPAAGGRRRWEFRESLSEGSHHPDWFRGVASGFLSEVAGQAPRGENLAEASMCVALLDLARESNRRGGEPLMVPAPLLSKRGGRLEIKSSRKGEEPLIRQQETAEARAPTAEGTAGSTSPTLLIIPARPAGAVGVSPGTVILGVPLLRRIVLAAARSGFGRVLVAAADGADEVERSLAGTAAALLAPGIPELAPGRIVVLSTRVLPQPGWFRSLLEMPVEPERLYIDPPSVALVETARPQVVLSALERGEPIADLFRRFQQRFQTVDRRLGGEGKIEIAEARDLPRAEEWLLKGLIKETEGFMSRHVERRISLALTRRLASTRIPPNAMTAVSVAVGLAGAGFFLSARPAWQFTGALLFLAHSILDGCDGELARLKFQESRFGGVLDFWGDNVVHVAVFAAIAIAWSRSIGHAWPLLLGAAAIGGTILSAGFVYRHTMVEVREGPLFTSVSPFSQSRLSRMADALARRDFIYLVLILSAFGKAHWFLVLAAAGAPVFFFVLVSIASAGRHLERKPS